MDATGQRLTTASLRTAVLAAAFALLAVACAANSAPGLLDEAEVVAAVPEQPATAMPIAEPTASPTPRPEPTPDSAIEPNLFDETFLAAAAENFSLTDGAVLLAAFDDKGMAEASAGTDAAGNSPTATDPFRVGSVTKVFTAVATLTLVDEGAVDLDMPAIEYVSRVAVPADVTVRDLLQHTSGLYDFAQLPEATSALDEGARVWTPEEVMELIGDRPPLFAAGSAFRYSNTNTLILGVLIEEVTGQPYHEVLRERIIDPLGLSSATYMAGFEEGPEPFDPYEHKGEVGYDYTAIATGLWSAGAMVSSASDLHLFFTALFDNQLVSADLVVQMTEGTEYGLGLELTDSFNGLYGHIGAVAGYQTAVRHSPELGVTFFAVSTDSVAPPPRLYMYIREMLRGLPR